MLQYLFQFFSEGKFSFSQTKTISKSHFYSFLSHFFSTCLCVTLPIILHQTNYPSLSFSKCLFLTFSFCLSFSQRLVFASLIQHLIKVMLTTLLHLLVVAAIFVCMCIWAVWKTKLALHLLKWPRLKENPLRAKAFASPFRLGHECSSPAICSSFRLAGESRQV